MIEILGMSKHSTNTYSSHNVDNIKFGVSEASYVRIVAYQPHAASIPEVMSEEHSSITIMLTQWLI